ncbi:MAG: beta-hydroxyacyl-ACP dehydratase [Oscillospiraceae bacterium]|nr:beta-hydroxyacyl-ACP dehydratase [Oscillospiraceae bacterium]
MNKEEIMNILPHRDDMLLLDRVEEENGEAHGFYRVKGDEFFLRGHFPGNPVVPGVIQCEILAQSVCVLLSGAMSEDKTPLYTGLNNVKFKNPVRPGDLFETKCRLTRQKPPFYFAEGEGYVGDKLCVKAEFSFAVMPKK